MPRTKALKHTASAMDFSNGSATLLAESDGHSEPVTRILAVDDHPENLRSLHEILDPLNVEIVDATSGAEALSLMLRQTFALVLLDVEMPGMSGLEVAEIMLSNELTHNVPIIFVTAADISSSKVAKAYQTGAVDFLQKPIPEEVLLGKIAVFLELYEHRRGLEDLLAELQESRSELTRQNDMFRNFASCAAHDLRAPMRQMLHLAQAIETTLQDDPQSSLLQLNMLKKSAKRGMDLIGKLIDYSTASVDVNETEIVDIQALVGDVISMLDGAYPGTNVNNSITLGNLPSLRCSGLQISRVFQNLIGNALKFGAPDRSLHISVTCEQHDNNFVFCVKDNGQGIPESSQDKVFQPLFRAPNSHLTDGSGLGLAICKLIIEDHRGKIWCESTPNVGTAFYFSLPITELDIGADSNEQTSPNLATQETELTILHLDDDPTELLIMEDMLKSQSKTVIYYAETGITCFFRTMQKVPNSDIILLDYNLNDIQMNGLDVLKQLREMGCTQPIIMISGNDSIATDAALETYQASFMHKDDLSYESIKSLFINRASAYS